MKKFYHQLLMVSCLLIITAGAFAQPGVLDQTFGNNGKVFTFFDSSQIAKSIAIQPDGKIIVAGGLSGNLISGPPIFYFVRGPIILTRYKTNGSLDSSFGVNGIVNTRIWDVPIYNNVGITIYNSYDQTAPLVRMALLPNGKILIGTTLKKTISSLCEAAVIRYNSNGTIDSTFGNVGDFGLRLASAKRGYDNLLLDMVVKADGKILIPMTTDTCERYNPSPNGCTTGPYLTAQLNPDGSLDSSFGINGVIEHINGDFAFSYNVWPDLTGGKYFGTSQNYLKKNLPNGGLDLSFGPSQTGYVINGYASDRVRQLRIDNQGRIISLKTHTTNGRFNFLLLRFNANGTLDSSFVTNRWTYPWVFLKDLEAVSATIQPDGKIYVTGTVKNYNPAGQTPFGSRGNFFIMRLNENGTADYTFGKRGLIITDMGGNLSDFCHAAALQSDGKMVLTGTTKIGSKNVFALVRYEKNARINYNSLYFKTYIDKNLNGIKDSSEPLYPNATAMVTRVGVDTIFTTSSSGEYLVDVDTGKYIVKVTPVLPYYNLVPTQYTKTFTSYFNEDTFFIGLQPIPGFKDVAVSLIPRLPLKPGNPLWHSMQCLNQGTDTISGTFTYIKDSRDTLGFSQITPTSIIGDTLHFAYTNLPPGGEITNDIYFIVPPPPLVNIGDTIHSFMYASPIAGETNIADNYSQLSEIVKGPWDPNDKQEAHGGKIALAKAKAGEYLTYTIRFQNTGNDTAFNVYVRDTMDSKLNWNSIQVIAASHNYQMTMNDGKCLFTFPMIKLVDSIKNEPLSHGYIVYKIKIKPNVQIGDVIKNTAAIYFDYNLPIFTNTEMTKVVADALPLKLLSFSAKKQDKTNLLQWQTANEINVDRFEVERSFDSRKFNKIGKVKAGLSNYSFIDNNALKATNYYRLRMVDKDGQFTYSPIRQITIDNSAFTITIFPNPAKDNLQVQIDSDKKMALKLQVISLDGKVLLNTSFNATEGSILRSINISALLRGSYLLKIKSIDVQEERVVKFEKL